MRSRDWERFYIWERFLVGGLGRTKCHSRNIVGIKFDTYALSGLGKVLYLGKVFGGWAWKDKVP